MAVRPRRSRGPADRMSCACSGPNASGSATPEFSSATLLPGDGMLLLQTTLILPGRGDVPLLQATRDADLAATGLNISGAPFSVLSQTRAGSQWLPAVEVLAGRPSSQISNDIVPDGSRAVAHFAAAADPAPVSQQGVEVTVESSLTGHGLELMMSARNISSSPRSLTLGWEPRVPGAHRRHVCADGDHAFGTKQCCLRDVAWNARCGRDLHQPEAQLSEHRTRGSPAQSRGRIYAAHHGNDARHPQPACSGGKAGKSVLLAFSTAAAKDGAESRTVVAPGATLEWRVRVEALAETTVALRTVGPIAIRRFDPLVARPYHERCGPETLRPGGPRQPCRAA